MPFSRLGPVTGLPLRRTSPVVGVSRPPTIRMTVVLPQPEGPTKTTNSPSPIERSSGSITSTSRPFSCSKILVSARNSMKSARSVMAASAQIAEPAAMQRADDLVGHQPDDADRQDAGEDLRRLAVAPRRPELVADAGIRCDDLRNDQIGPAPAQGDAQAVHHVGQHGGKQHVLDQGKLAGAKKTAGPQE